MLVRQVTRDDGSCRRDDIITSQSVMFVCNKWDQIPAAEIDIVWDFTLTELQKVWPHFNQDLVFKMDTLQVDLLV